MVNSFAHFRAILAKNSKNSMNCVSYVYSCVILNSREFWDKESLKKIRSLLSSNLMDNRNPFASNRLSCNRSRGRVHKHFASISYDRFFSKRFLGCFGSSSYSVDVYRPSKTAIVYFEIFQRLSYNLVQMNIAIV